MEQFVVENINGEVVRSLRWNTENAFIVSNRRTNRVEFHAENPISESKSIETRKGQKEDLVLITELTKSEVRRRPQSIEGLGLLKAVDSVTSVTPSVRSQPESDKDFFISLKWSAIVNTGFVTVVILVGLIVSYFFTDKPIEVVEIQLPNIEKKAIPTVKVSETKVKKIVNSTQLKRPKTAKVSTKQKQIVVQSKVQTKNRAQLRSGHSNGDISRAGSLGVLGSLSSRTKSMNGGIDFNHNNASAGPGYGGQGSSGGVQKSFYGKGLVAAPLGLGGNIKGQGGTGQYGTRGAGGGKAGYGQLSMVGSSAGYYQPLDNPTIFDGGLDMEQVGAVIRKNMGQIVYCYEKGLQGKPELKGRVAVEFVIGAAGMVNTARVSSTSLKHGGVEGCIVAKLRGWKFPKPEGRVNVKVAYPFMLKRYGQG